MTDRPPLNPPEMPLCPVYDNLYAAWVGTPEALKDNRIMAFGALFEHRRACPVCQARKAEFDELARNAKEPEVKDEQQTAKTAT